MEYIIAPKARRDIKDILAWSLENFGPNILKRYRMLIDTAIEDVAENPERSGSIERPEICVNCRTYHLLFSRKKASQRGKWIRRPRHFLLYRVKSGVVEIGRVLHDAMDLELHVPSEFREPSE
jgi:toxin ParE1/3/4